MPPAFFCAGLANGRYNHQISPGERKLSSFRIGHVILAIGIAFVAGCPGGGNSPTAPPPATATPPPAATSTPVATAVPTSTPTRTPTPAVTGAVCANLSGEWESDWTICTRTQENPGPGVFFAQTGCNFTAAILGLGTFSGTISGTVDAPQISWSFAMTPPCTGTATGLATIDTSMGQT